MNVSKLLDRFLEARDTGPFAYPWCHHQPGTAHQHHVVFSLMIHGDEFGTLPAAVELVESMKRGAFRSAGPVTVTLGNPEAAVYDKRFLDADLNRVWAFVDGAVGHEHRRARELQPIFDSADLMLDLHQTILESPAFWIFPWDPTVGAWARTLQSATRGLTRSPDAVFASPDLLCGDEYLRAKGKVAFCVELGQKGFSATQAANALRTFHRTLEVVDRIQAGQTTLEAEAAAQPPIEWYTTAHKEDWGPAQRALAPGLVNWSPVKAGVDLAAAGSPPIVPPVDGVVLFPKYPDPDAPRPSQQFHLATLLGQPPEEAFPS